MAAVAEEKMETLEMDAVMFEGESCLIRTRADLQTDTPGVLCPIEVWLTDFRILFVGTESPRQLELLLLSVDRVDVVTPTELLITNKGAGMAVIVFPAAGDLEQFVQTLESLYLNHSATFQPPPGLSAGHEYRILSVAFAELARTKWGGLAGDQAPWIAYDVEAEYRRLIPPGSGWRLSRANEQYAISPTYPALVAVPSAITDEEVATVASMRFKDRFPILCWRHPLSGATITRAAQPRSNGGLLFKGGRNTADEAMVLEIVRASCACPGANDLEESAGEAPPKLYIVDARPQVNAAFNAARGGGYENELHYKHSKVVFMDIENIHAMRESLRKLRLACHRGGSWLSDLCASKWLAHIECVLRAGVRIAQIIETGTSALIHCSDGWDRTAQLSSVAMILLDPYYRTMQGFQVLIEKEWVSVGHRFATRTGHHVAPVIARNYLPKGGGGLWGLAKGITSAGMDLMGAGHSDERSPIFLQFLDCCSQIMRQFPDAFEFNDRFLTTLADCLYGAMCGNFLSDCERERETSNVRYRTISVWTLLASQRIDYLNPSYRNVSPAPLRMCCSAKRLVLWESYFLRFTGEAPGDPNWTMKRSQPPSPVAWNRSASPEASSSEGGQSSSATTPIPGPLDYQYNHYDFNGNGHVRRVETDSVIASDGSALASEDGRSESSIHAARHLFSSAVAVTPTMASQPAHPSAFPLGPPPAYAEARPPGHTPPTHLSPLHEHVPAAAVAMPFAIAGDGSLQFAAGAGTEHANGHGETNGTGSVRNEQNGVEASDVYEKGKIVEI